MALASNIHVRATDESNNPLPQVQVQILSQGNTVRRAVSNSQGQAEFAELPNGVYDITASKIGFETATQTHVAIQNNSLQTIEIVLSPKIAVREEVKVAGSDVPLEEPASQAVEISRREIKDLAANSTTVRDVLPLVPGVLRSTDGQIQISGQSEHHSTFL